jgi:hypothetical protein
VGHLNSRLALYLQIRLILFYVAEKKTLSDETFHQLQQLGEQLLRRLFAICFHCVRRHGIKVSALLPLSLSVYQWEAVFEEILKDALAGSSSSGVGAAQLSHPLLRGCAPLNANAAAS